MAKIKKYTKEELEALNNKAINAINTTEVKLGRKSESEEFLISIKEVIKTALDKKVSLVQISKIIKDIYSINLSVNIIKTFAINHLNYVPKKRLGANAQTKRINAIDKTSDNTNANKQNTNDRKTSSFDDM